MHAHLSRHNSAAQELPGGGRVGRSHRPTCLAELTCQGSGLRSLRGNGPREGGLTAASVGVWRLEREDFERAFFFSSASARAFANAPDVPGLLALFILMRVLVEGIEMSEFREATE